MEAVTSIDQLWDVVRDSPLVAHYILIEALLGVAIVLFWLRLRRIGRDVGRLRLRTRELSEAIDESNPAFAEYKNALRRLKYRNALRRLK